MDILLILLAAAALAASGLPGLLLGRRRNAGQWFAAVLMVLGSMVGISGVAIGYLSPNGAGLALPWFLPWGRFAVAADATSAVFLLPIFFVPPLGAVYGLRYWKQSDHPDSARKLQFFYGLLAAAMALVVVARDGVLFLMAWEIMALAAFFLVTTEDEEPAVRRGGWVYLVATHAGTLCLLAMFALLHAARGSFALGTPLEAVPPGIATAIFLLALLGFGLKAGVMPLHIWLPGAHANAPSHVSAVMSGVMIKMGIYGLLRIAGLFPHPPPSWGVLVLVLGAVSGVMGIVFANAQHDLKRLLAYCSIENIGIILLGLGLALLGRSLDRPDWIALGLAGALLHVWNHGLFKSLLFLASGSVIHAVHTRQMDRMGGLAKSMPRTACGFLIGAVAICGLPPLNGFMSELLIYLGLFSTVGVGPGTAYPAAAAAVPILAMIGALAVACFVKAFGVIFLGEPRTAAEPPHESPRAMLAPMAVLAAFCFTIGLAPTLAAPMLDRAVAAWSAGATSPPPLLESLVSLKTVSMLAMLLLVSLLVGTALLWRKMRRGSFHTVGTWDCGYLAPVPRIQYTASSFAQILVDLFAWALRPRVHRPRLKGIFPKPARFESHADDTVLDGALLPVARALTAWLLRARSWQRGRSQLYIFYILVVIVVLFIVAGRGNGMLP